MLKFEQIRLRPFLFNFEAKKHFDNLHCVKCPRFKECGPQISPSGPYDSEFLFIGRDPGEQEVEHKTPFFKDAPGGKLFHEYLQVLGLRREQVHVTNSVYCRGHGNRPVEPNEIMQCLPYHTWEFEQLTNVKYVFPLGTDAFNLATGIFSSITPYVGKGLICRHNKRTIFIFPVHHPGYVLRQASEKTKIVALLEDIRKFIDKRRGRSFSSHSMML